jgi:perosamine synthetase
MILTNDPAINEKSKSLRNLSFSKSYFDRFNHTDLGWNYRLTNLQAAIGCGQLEKIKWIVKKKEK